MLQHKTRYLWGVLAILLAALADPAPGAISVEPEVTPAASSLPVMGLPDAGASSGGPVASSVVPGYSSLPAAPYTLYLNFGGINYPGTWGGRTPENVPAYDIDNNPSSFSSTELENIEQIWGRVSEAYSPFNVNITTVAPGATPVGGEWSQVIIAAENASGSDWYGYYGGVAYLYGFWSGGMQSGTGWAFTNHLGNGAPKYTAVAAAHEAGHQFGLYHQKQYDADGHLTSEYRGSTDGNLTAPTMGVAYYSVRSLWSNGASASATSHQYDTSILVSTLGYRPDDDNHDIAHAKPLTVTGGISVSASGIIEQPTEYDLYSFATGAGQVTLNVVHSSYAGMLDSKLILYQEDGTPLQTIDPALTQTGPDYGLDATFSGYLSAGTYYLGVTSHGGYGDLGQYTVTGSISPVPEPGTFMLLAAGSAFLLAYAWRRQKKRPPPARGGWAGDGTGRASTLICITAAAARPSSPLPLPG